MYSCFIFIIKYIKYIISDERLMYTENKHKECHINLSKCRKETSRTTTKCIIIYNKYKVIQYKTKNYCNYYIYINITCVIYQIIDIKNIFILKHNTFLNIILL